MFLSKVTVSDQYHTEIATAYKCRNRAFKRQVLDTADSANFQQLGPIARVQFNIITADRTAYLEKAVFGIIAFVWGAA